MCDKTSNIKKLFDRTGTSMIRFGIVEFIWSLIYGLFIDACMFDILAIIYACIGSYCSRTSNSPHPDSSGFFGLLYEAKKIEAAHLNFKLAKKRVPKRDQGNLLSIFTYHRSERCYYPILIN